MNDVRIFGLFFLSELLNKAHLNEIRFQLCRVKLPTLIINGERIVLWQVKHWAGLSGSSLVRGMSTIFVIEFGLGVRSSLIGPNRSHFQGSPFTALTSEMAFHWKSETIPLRQCLWLELNTLPTMCRIIQTKYALWKNMHAGGCHQYSKFQTASSSPTVKSVWRRNMKCNVVELHFNLNPSSWDWQDHTMTSMWNTHKTIKNRTSLILCME